MKISKLLLIVLVTVLLSFCTKDTSNEFIDDSSITADRLIMESALECVNVDLMAGQNYDAGDFTITLNDGDYIIRYETMNGWELDAVHLYIGDCDEIPISKSGNPKIGKFTIKETFADGTTVFEYVLEDDIAFCGCIAAHAEVSKDGQNETAWAQGMSFAGKSWAMFLQFCGCAF
jgi:hypothetical protein